MTVDFSADREWALAADAADELRGFRDRFAMPEAPGQGPGSRALYLCGNSLGLMPRAAADHLRQELDDWARLAVEGHFEAQNPWYSYHEQFRNQAAMLVGALPHEVVMMNSLTVNLHLMMVTFYRPEGARTKIVVDEPTFPSDSYALSSQARVHGLDPASAILRLRPRKGESTIRTEDVLDLIDREGDTIALMLMSGVNFATGQWHDMPAITAAAKARGCAVGWDLAHAAGNVPLRLHEWGADFACWCTYKYLNCGPGAVAGCFIHEKHVNNTDLPRFAGWWGNDPDTRFRMGPDFHPVQRADAWALSNPPIFSMTPMRSSFTLFEQAGLDRLRAKSLRLTGYLEWLIDRLETDAVQIITPRDPNRRGCQLSLRIAGDARAVRDGLRRAGVILDFREPDILRAAPTPLYNSFEDVHRFAEILVSLT